VDLLILRVVPFFSVWRDTGSREFFLYSSLLMQRGRLRSTSLGGLESRSTFGQVCILVPSFFKPFRLFLRPSLLSRTSACLQSRVPSNPSLCKSNPLPAVFCLSFLITPPWSKFNWSTLLPPPTVERYSIRNSLFASFSFKEPPRTSTCRYLPVLSI